jgi:hypothetical protein
LIPDLRNVTLEPNPVMGFALPLAIRLDQAHPGYMRHLSTCSTLKRQANFLALSIMEEKGADHLVGHFTAAGLTKDHASHDPHCQIAHVLITARAQDLCECEALFGRGSAASVRLLHRIGNGPLPQTAYRRLIHLMSRPELQDRARLLMQGCPISKVGIEAALRLPTPLLRQEVISRLHSVEQVEQLRVALDTILSLLPEAEHGEVWQSLACLSPSTSLCTWLRRLIDKVPSFPIACPFEGDADVTFLTSPKAMRDTGRRMFNCLSTKIAHCFLQRSLYANWHNPEAIIELQSLSREYWVISGIHGVRNSGVDPETLRAIRAKFDGGRVLVPAQFAEAKHINQSAKLFGVCDFGSHDLGDEDFDLAQLEGEG